jgi:MoxR-like ATPase
MIANQNYKCRFFKGHLDPNTGKVINYMISNQAPFRDKQSGKEVHWDTSLMVVFADFSQGALCKEGEVYAAASIEHLATHNYYVVKGKVLRVQDEDGIMITDDGYDPDHARAIELWDSFSSGFVVQPVGVPANHITAKTQPRVLTELEKIQKDARYKPPTVEQDGFWVATDLWYDLVMCAKNRVSVLLLGPKGTGKTELIDLVASKIGFAYDCFDMSIQNPYSYLCGNTRLTDKGETTFQYARFAQLVQSPESTIVCLDELSRCAPNASNILLPVLDRRRTLYVENAIEETGRVLSIGEKVTFFATANMGTEYLGVVGLDEALFDRFVVMETSYPPKTVESKLLQARTKISKREADLLAAFAERVRNNKDISTKISTRKLLEIGRWVYWGHDLKAAINKAALSIWSSDETDGGERVAVKAIMQSLN